MMAPSRWRLRWYHIILALGLFIVLFGAHPTSRDTSRAYVDKLAAQWGFKNSPKNDYETTTVVTPPDDEEQLEELGFEGENLPVADLATSSSRHAPTPSTIITTHVALSTEHALFPTHSGIAPMHSASATTEDDEDEESETDVAPPAFPSDALYWNEKLIFQNDIWYIELPTFDKATLKHYKPHNYKGPGHETYATFFATRNASMQDPYFVAAQQVVYRLLWDQRSCSVRHPVTVFVAPFVTHEQRDYFAAAGAIVRELDLLEFIPAKEQTDGMLAGRLVDVLSKLLMWNQTDFSRIAFLDSDAFPRQNVDRIFSDEIAPLQTCIKSRLPSDDQHAISTLPETCEYVFSGVVESSTMVNAGVFVLKPDAQLAEMLLRDSKHQEKYNNGFIEQAFLSYFYRQDGPFPFSNMSEVWNSAPSRLLDGWDVQIVHGKLWVLLWEPNTFIFEEWNATWNEMLKFYNSEQFAQLRYEDDLLAYGET